jgi:hypothetical protein
MLVNVLDFVIGEQRDDGIGGWRSKWPAVAHVCSRRARAPVVALPQSPQSPQSLQSLRRAVTRLQELGLPRKECDARAATPPRRSGARLSPNRPLEYR